MKRATLPAAGGLGWLSFLLLMATLPGLGEAVRGEVVRVGAGSYRTTPPKPCKPLPDRIYRTADLTGPVPVSQWWSSLVWQAFSQPMFAQPLMLRCGEGGLAVSYPGGHVTANRVGIFGLGAGPMGDLQIGHSAVAAFAQADCGGFSDWFVTAVFASGGASLRASFGHGSPYVFCVLTGGHPVVRFPETPHLWAGDAAGPTLGVTVHGHHYGLFGPAGSRWVGVGGRRLENRAGTGVGYFTVALLPEASPATLARFARHAHNHVADTRVAYTVAGGQVRVRHRFRFLPFEGEDNGTICALFPHQWKYTEAPLMAAAYGSIRGALKLFEGREFETVVPVQGVLPRLPGAGLGDRDRVRAYLEAAAAEPPAAFGDTYWEGKHLGRLASLSGVAEAAGLADLRAQFVGEMRRRLEAWFTATPGQEAPVFYHDARWGALVGSRPSYGADLPLNDHQFHYGYFIRAAAEVARAEPAWATQWGPMVRLLIRDIASDDRDDPMFPHWRCFDPYAGHSWASGDANFADGNNQESSSESMNAWYGLILWGAVTGDDAVRDTGVFLYNLERTGIEEYWFDVSGSNFPETFPHEALGMVWGGKGVFETWFSPKPDMIHGINWLPFTPGSFYLGRHPDYVRRSHDSVVAARKGGANYNTDWGDLLCMFGALHDAGPAVAYVDRVRNFRVESGNSRAFMYHWVHTLQQLGQVDASQTADHPLAVVFTRAGQRTYVAWNPGAAPLPVGFSDGHRFTVAPRSMLVRHGELALRRAAGRARLSWRGETGWRYTVETADRPDGEWSPLADAGPLPGLGGPIELAVEPVAPARFYRLLLRP